MIAFLPARGLLQMPKGKMEVIVLPPLAYSLAKAVVGQHIDKFKSVNIVLL